MPAKSKAQQRLFAAAEHGATFPKAQSLADHLTHAQLHDFASGPLKGKPAHVTPPPAPRHRLAGSHDGLYVTEHHRKAKKK